MFTSEYPEHGGNIPWAVHTFGIASEHWIDLSTGISPWVYPVGEIPESVWRKLPYEYPKHQDKLFSAAANYFDCSSSQLCLAPGTQYIIEHLPHFYPKQQVALPLWGYREHQLAWQRHHCPIHYYQGYQALIKLLTEQDIPYVVIIRPNNPSTEFFSQEQVKHIENLLIAKHGDNYLLLIDEAFIDLFPGKSFVHLAPQKHSIILRSVGKFFGLAGLRLGFMIAHVDIIKQFDTFKGQWLTSSPAVFIGERALQDTNWIQQQGQRIWQQSETLNKFLADQGLAQNLQSCGLFSTVFGEEERLSKIFITLAQAGILVRYFPGEALAALRFGLPGQKENECFKRIMESLHV